MAPRLRRIAVPPGPVRALPVITAINVGVFVLWQVLIASGMPELGVSNLVVSTDNLAQLRLWTLLTSAFSHNLLWHLGFNMLALWVFGRDVERIVGARGFWHLYLAGGVFASLGHAIYSAAFGSPIGALGASGSVMAVAVVSAVMFPNRLLLLFFVIPMPQLVAVGLFVLIDIVGALSPTGDMIAHAAHLGGAAYGWFWMRTYARTYIHDRMVHLGLKPTWHANYGVWTHPPAP